MASLTLATLRSLTSYVVGDPQNTTFSLAMYQDAINFAIKDYAKKTGATYLESSPIVPDASGFVTIPTSYIRLQRVSFLVGGTTLTQLIESTFNFESLKSNVWQSATGVPKRWVLWSGAKIKLTPIPSPVYSATVGYVEDPADLTTDAGTVDARIPEAHQEYLKYAAASWLFQLDGDTQDLGKADNFMQKFNSLIGYSDPVLETKLQSARTQAAREV